MNKGQKNKAKINSTSNCLYQPWVTDLANSFHHFYNLEVKVIIFYVLGAFLQNWMVSRSDNICLLLEIIFEKKNHKQFVKNAIN